MSSEGAIPIFAALAVWLVRMRELATKRVVIPGKRAETLTFNLFMVCGLVIIFGGIAEFILRGRRFYWTTLLLGLVLAVGSFAIRRRAIAVLGPFWSLHVEMREKHEFIRTGPFAWVRHPVYLSMILELIGAGLILHAWVTLIAVALIFIPTLAQRLKLEEAALAAKFGPAFDEYKRSTPMLFPSPRRHRS